MILSKVNLNKNTLILKVWLFLFLPMVLLAQSTDKPDTAITKGKKPLAAFWIKNLFFTRGILVRDELLDRFGNGAFRSRWRFIYSNPFGPRFSVQVEVPYVLAVPSEGESSAGFGSISTLFQGAIEYKKSVQQIVGMRIFYPTGSHLSTGGDLMALNPQYHLSFIENKNFIPTSFIEYYHSVINWGGAKEIRLLALRPYITFPRLAPSRFGFSGSVELEWDFDFVADRNGGLVTLGMSKQINSKTALRIEYSPAFSSYTRERMWENRYAVDILMTF